MLEKSLSLPGIHTSTLAALCVNNVPKERTDALVLKYMAKKMALTARTLEPADVEQLPALFSLTERYSRAHRIMLFHPSLLVEDIPLLFVGFVSEYSASVSSQTLMALEHADQHMLSDLVHLPGLIGYSSLALRNDHQHKHWYNFVVFQSAETKAHLHDTHSHQHAAYQVAPRVYNWIRIHQGTLAHGLATLSFQLRSTKHYVFRNAFPNGQKQEESQAMVMMHELVY